MEAPTTVACVAVEPPFKKCQRTEKMRSLLQGFVIWRFFFIYFSISGVKKIFRHTEDFVIQSFVISRFHYSRVLSKDIFVHLVKRIRSFGLFCGCSFTTVTTLTRSIARRQQPASFTTINHCHYCEKTTCAVWRSAEVNLIKKSSSPSELISGLD